MLKLAFLVAATLAVVAIAATPSATPTPPIINDHLSAADVKRIRDHISTSIPSDDLPTHFYGVLYSDPAAINPSIVQHLERAFRNERDVRRTLSEFSRIAYRIGSATLSGNCAPDLIDAAAIAVIQNQRGKWTTTHECWQYIETLRYLELNKCHKLQFARLDDAQRDELARALVQLVKKNDSLTSLGWAFATAARLGSRAAAVADWIEGAIAQADEIDGKMLQLEGGLSVTALVLNGALKLSAALKRPAPLSAEQSLKFTRYFLSRRLVQNAKGGGLLLEVLDTIAATPAISPVCIQLIGNGQLNGEQPVLAVTVNDVLGRPLLKADDAAAKITVDVREAGKSTKTVVAAKELVKRSSDGSVYSTELPKLQRGAYTVQIRAGAAGRFEQQLPVRVLGHVKCTSAEIGVGETDSSTAGVRKQTVQFGQRLSEVLVADAQQKLWLQTALFEAASGGAAAQPLQVHQFFVRVASEQSEAEIIYVAEVDSKNRYTFELDVGARSADFAHRSGRYVVELIVGDASLVNSFRWPVATVQLNFGEQSAAPEQSGQSAQQLRGGAFGNRALKPTIRHTFRVPEQRPSRVVSDLFTLLCAAPLVVLLVLWTKLGVNVANFPCSLSAVGFHAGFGAILTLFGVFFWQLNMFETVRYLVPLAVVTFIFGNRLLRSIANGKA